MDEYGRILAPKEFPKVGAECVTCVRPPRHVPHALDVFLVQLNGDNVTSEHVRQGGDVGLAEEHVVLQRILYLCCRERKGLLCRVESLPLRVRLRSTRTMSGVTPSAHGA